VRHPRTGPNARARREPESRRLAHLLEREGIEPRRDLALESRLVALLRMLARPAAIAAVCVADCLASRTVYGGAAPWIVARFGLHGECLASRGDRAEAMLAARYRHARLAMTTPALEHRLAA
jgi:hypothetical protein